MDTYITPTVKIPDFGPGTLGYALYDKYFSYNIVSWLFSLYLYSVVLVSHLILFMVTVGCIFNSLSSCIFLHPCVSESCSFSSLWYVTSHVIRGSLCFLCLMFSFNSFQVLVPCLLCLFLPDRILMFPAFQSTLQPTADLWHVHVANTWTFIFICEMVVIRQWHNSEHRRT